MAASENVNHGNNYIVCSEYRVLYTQKFDYFANGTGITVQLVCKYRPINPFICVTSNEVTDCQMFLCCGAIPFNVSSVVFSVRLIIKVFKRFTEARLVQMVL